MNNNIIKIPVYLGLFLLLTGISYFTFDKLFPAVSNKNLIDGTSQDDNKTTDPSTGVITFSGPKTEMCPLNGQMFTKEEKEIWSKRRPLLVMTENHSDSRPQSGLQSADIVYEAVAEGGITRFMAVYYCGIVQGSQYQYDVGPVRSARSYYVDLASEYGDYPLYNHVGGANCSGAENASTKYVGPCTTDKRAQALEQIASYGWNSEGTWSDLNQFSLSYKACRREPERTGEERATEHTMYCSTKELYNIAEKRGLTNITSKTKSAWDKNYRPWSFKQQDQASSSPKATNIALEFWSGYKDYAVNWKYDQTSNTYLRSHKDQAHIDFNTGKQINTKNLVIQYAKESRNIDEHKHNLYGVIGNGTGILFQNGEKIDITWSKPNRLSRTIFKDSAGKEINFVPGQIWVEIIPIGSTVDYEGSV